MPHLYIPFCIGLSVVVGSKDAGPKRPTLGVVVFTGLRLLEGSGSLSSVARGKHL
jgi:hypothetical protein